MIKRIVFVGDQFSGKTTIIDRFINKDHKDFFTYFPTNGIDLNIYNIDDIKYYFWDTSGDMRYRYIIYSYTKKCNCVVIVYDISDIKNSVENLRVWINNIRKENNHVKIITVANKIDKIKYCQEEILSFKLFLFEQYKIFQDIECDIENDDVHYIFSKIFEITKNTENVKIIEKEESTIENDDSYFEKNIPKNSLCCFCL